MPNATRLALIAPASPSVSRNRHDRGVTAKLPGVRTVLLPGSGSDDDYVRRAFSGALVGAGAILVTPAPEPGRLIEGYVEALNDAASDGPIAVGGVSIGAAVAVAWALAHPRDTVAVLAALPPWTGASDGAPAVLAARHTADQLRRNGLAATTSDMRASSPTWLADELDRSWTAQWPRLPEAFEEAARYVAPNRDDLSHLRTPMGIVAAQDDPIHPLEVGLEWASAAPRAALRIVALEEFGPDPERLGAQCLAALGHVLL